MKIPKNYAQVIFKFNQVFFLINSNKTFLLKTVITYVHIHDLIQELFDS